MQIEALDEKRNLGFFTWGLNEHLRISIISIHNFDEQMMNILLS